MSKNLTEDKIFKLNPFIDRISSNHFRACVGKNSGVATNSRDCIIIDGYKETVDLLYESMIGKSNKQVWIDIGIYPFLFACRHSIELSLKVILKNLIIIYKNKNKIETSNNYIGRIESVCKEHDLKLLYNELIDFKDFQLELKEAFNNFKYFKECIQDYFFDISGDTFRYTFKRNLKEINFENVEIIDVGVLYFKYKKLMNFLDYSINSFSKELNNDYSKTYTQNLSRSRLEKLSLDLKDIKSWSKEEILRKKDELCEKYSISKSEFDKALKKIKKHYSFSVNIGIENKFKDLNEEIFRKMGKIYQMLLKAKSAEIPRPNGAMAINFTEIDKYYPLARECHDFCTQVSESLTKDEKRILLTFYEVTSNPIDGGYFCEDIDYLYNTWDDILDNDDYIGEKLEYLVDSGKLREALIKCGQLTYLQWYDKYITH